MRPPTPRTLASPILLALCLALALPGRTNADTVLAGLGAPVEVTLDAEGVPHIVARDDLDLARAAGFVHARDRFLQMDLTRRQVSGDLAELLGPGVLEDDIQARTVGLRRAAERSETVLTARERAILQAYADGVNSYLTTHPLPPEYAALELTEARPWDVIDTLAIGKAIAASLSLDIDVGLTLLLDAFVEAGHAGGFDGQALFADVVRSAPIDPAATVPDADSSFPFVAAPRVDTQRLAGLAAGAERVRDRMARLPFLAPALDRRDTQIGSNEWGVAASHSASGFPIIANDPHLSLNIPATFYEWHLVVRNDPLAGPANVNGVGFPGFPGVILGQTPRVTWGATTNPMDVSDIFQDELHVLLPQCFALQALACIRSDGVFYPVDVMLGVVYRFNQIGDGIQDNLATADLPLENTLIATVPFRSFGPVVDIENPGVLAGGGVTNALVLQFTGFHATLEGRTFLTWNRARNLDDFLRGLQFFDFGSQNWAYADADGNLAYFSSAELPLRRDLEQGVVHGLPPAFIRDGSGPANWVPDPGRSQGQSIPFDVLPSDEMPQVVNPANGFFVNANNDPAGTTLDNDPLNQRRPSKPSAIYYLNPGYANGLRAGRITRLVREKLDAGEKISVQDMKRFQANVQQLDAELLTPFLIEAWQNARRAGAPAALAALAADRELAEAVGRLGAWDFSTPTGIPEGYDAHDRFGRRSPAVPRPEARASVAATIYNLWRGKLLQAVIDARLAALGAPGVGSGDSLKALFHLLREDPFDGRGDSGVDFFPEPAGLAATDRRDVALLGALRTALDALASDTFAPAFARSRNQDDYRWGKLHRITFDHPFLPQLSIPPAAGFEDVAPDLPGLARDGGYEVVNASGFSARADGLNSFRFGGGPVRRYVGEAGGSGPFRVRGQNAMPGGPSGVPGSPGYATQLGDWLTADYHRVPMRERLPRRRGTTRETFVPSE